MFHFFHLQHFRTLFINNTERSHAKPTDFIILLECILSIYIGRSESSILYFGEIDSITKPLQSKDELTQIQEKDKDTFETGKRVVHLKQSTFVKLEDPIPLKNKRMAPRGIRYTTLEKLVHLNYLEEL